MAFAHGTHSIGFFFAESNPLRNYVHGHIENLIVVDLINFFPKNNALPTAAEEVSQGKVDLQRLTFEMAL